MDSLRGWVLLLAGVALVSAVVAAAIPDGQNKRAFRVLCAVVLLYAALLPLRGLSLERLDLDDLLQPREELQAALEESEADAAVLAAQTALETALTERLRQAGFADARVRVTCARFDDGVAPTQITVTGECEQDAVSALLQTYLTPHTAWRLVTEEADGD